MCHRQVDIGDPLLASDLRKVEGEDEVDVVGCPAHHEDRHHHPEHFHLVEENTENRRQMSNLIQGLRSV